MVGVEISPWWRKNFTMVASPLHHGEIFTAPTGVFTAPWWSFYSTMVEFLTEPWCNFYSTMVEFLTEPWWSFTELLALTKNQPPEPPKANGGEKAT